MKTPTTALRHLPSVIRLLTSDLRPPSAIALAKVDLTSDLWRRYAPLALFAVLWLDLIRQLSYTWQTSDQYAYGWFVPFFAAARLWRRWQDRPMPEVGSQWSVVSGRPHPSFPAVESSGTQVLDSSSPLSPLSPVQSAVRSQWSVVSSRPSFLLSATIFLLCLLLEEAAFLQRIAWETVQGYKQVQP